MLKILFSNKGAIEMETIVKIILGIVFVGIILLSIRYILKIFGIWQ